MKIEASSHFKREHKKFIKNDRIRKEAIAIALRLFTKNPRHPGLNLEKLKGSDY